MYHRGHTRIWVDWAVVAMLAVWATPVTAQSDSNSPATREYRVKAAFLYNFISFVDGWPFDQAGQDKDRPIRIAIIGRSPFKDTFDPLTDKRVHGRRIEVRCFKGCSELDGPESEHRPHPDIDAVKQCDLLFVCSSEERHFAQILDPIRTEPILTVADTEGFLEAGGIINLTTEKSNVHIEINTAAAKRAKLVIRSKLLRLAKRIVDKDNVGKNTK